MTTTIDSQENQKWSVIGIGVLLAVPILQFILGALWASDLKVEADLQGANPSVELMGMALASLALRIGGGLMLFISFIFLMKPVPKSFPKWLKR